MSDLLPPSASAPERALSRAAARLGDVPVRVREQWNPDTCPLELLPWLAWAFSVDEWDAEWSEETKRQTVREALEIQRRKGTVASVRRVLATAGYGDAVIQEGRSGGLHDGVFDHSGVIDYGDPQGWAEYRVILQRTITSAQAAQVRKILEATAPARCSLYQLSFDEVAFTYNGAIRYDGTFTYGAA